jgi:hypothetical protein
MQIAKGLVVPVRADSVLTPEFYYGDNLTGIYFVTDDDLFGRITFNNLDSVKISRGEYLPFTSDWDEKSAMAYPWVYEIEGSQWLKARHDYEVRHYQDCYEFGGDVDEMLIDFRHYLFSFHDQFIEVIARGFWFETAVESLKNQPLSIDHPIQPLPKTNGTTLSAYGLISYVRFNPLDIVTLKRHACYHQQTLMEFRLDNQDAKHADHRLSLERRGDRFITRLSGYMGNNIAIFEHIAALEEIKPYIERYLCQVAERRKS